MSASIRAVFTVVFVIGLEAVRVDDTEGDGVGDSFLQDGPADAFFVTVQAEANVHTQQALVAKERTAVAKKKLIEAKNAVAKAYGMVAAEMQPTAKLAANAASSAVLKSGGTMGDAKSAAQHAANEVGARESSLAKSKKDRAGARANALHAKVKALTLLLNPGSKEASEESIQDKHEQQNATDAAEDAEAKQAENAEAANKTAEKAEKAEAATKAAEKAEKAAQNKTGDAFAGKESKEEVAEEKKDKKKKEAQKELNVKIKEDKAVAQAKEANAIKEMKQEMAVSDKKAKQAVDKSEKGELQALKEVKKVTDAEAIPPSPQATEKAEAELSGATSL